MNTNSSFDAFHKILGLSPGTNTPNHYEVLGLTRFEPDAETIRRAANTQNRRAQDWQSTQPLAASQIEDMIVDAKEILLNERKKSAYDVELKRILGDISTLVHISL